MATSEAATGPASLREYYMYRALLARGKRFQKWMDGPDTGETGVCPFQPPTANISLTQLEKNDLGDCEEAMEYEEYLLDQLRQPMQEFRKEYFDSRLNDTVTFWQGLIGKGILVIESVFREHGPFMSQISQRAYEKYYEIKTLRHVMVLNIVNIETQHLILYTLGLKKESHPRACYEHGTSAYQALIGTEIGRIVVALILSAFPRGTVRISRIFISNVDGMPQMRLDIERTLAPAIRKSLAENGLSEKDLETGSELSDLPEDLSEEESNTNKNKGKQKAGGKSKSYKAKVTTTGPNVKTRSMTRKEKEAAQKKI
ncbi:uncharacterized protein N7483_012426 [Penicillium malachiteum]|uniref:uncharacterized protein n=1 Tax=Penicillium malachiteum TaxID=1324776 RepID=UPI002547EC90|nr:uncharacterized protein N7483_012426 [Penicillium malachiteum]KAJ5715245.1 hypothetical protein N7483_012426 [Penicillium malachiteum]